VKTVTNVLTIEYKITDGIVHSIAGKKQNRQQHVNAMPALMFHAISLLDSK